MAVEPTIARIHHIHIYSAVLAIHPPWYQKCHDLKGDLYFLNIARDRVTLSSYKDDQIRYRVEMWADGVPGLA